MRRLFLQFYVSVLIILACTGIIHFIIFTQRTSFQNFAKVEQNMAGGIRIAAAQLAETPPDHREAVLNDMRRRLDYPAEMVSEELLPGPVKFRLRLGHDAAMYLYNKHVFICSPVDRESKHGILVFGPLPQVAGPSQTDIAVGISLILALMGIAIYLALRPVSRQLRLLENSILNFARGNLGTRAIEDPISPLLELAQTFNLMATRTESLVRTQRELLQAVSHELRTPLSRINFGMDLARHAANADEREEQFQAVESASYELDQLIGELLRYVRLESDGTPLNLVEIPVVATLQEVLDGQQVVLSQREFLFQSAESELYLVADAISFRRAFSNLISNAGKYAKSRVRVSVRRENDRIAIQVEDDGPGIPDGHAARVFEPFVRLTDNVKGVGLGLAVVRRILEKHRAQVSLQRSDLGGASFTVYWPVHPPQKLLHQQQLQGEIHERLITGLN